MTDAKRLGILAFEGFEELDAIGPYEVFQNATGYGADWTVDLLATEPTDRVTAAYGLRVEPDGVLPGVGAWPDPDSKPDPGPDTGPDTGSEAVLDYLVVPGGGWNDGAERGARAVAADDAVLGALQDLHGDGTTLASVCTGGMVLAAAGLLDGRPAVTHSGALDDLRATDAEVVEARVVDDGDVLTAGGITAGIDLALWLVEREWGADVAGDVADVMEYERSGDVYRGEA